MYGHLFNIVKLCFFKKFFKCVSFSFIISHFLYIYIRESDAILRIYVIYFNIVTMYDI